MQNLRTIGQGVFVRREPENGMFPWESEVVLNTVLSVNALTCDNMLNCQKERMRWPDTYAMLKRRTAA
jgi:hypothetical protein